MGLFRCLFSIVFLFPLDIFSEVELLGHVVLMVLIFWDSSILFFIMAIPSYSPTTSAQGSPFLHIHTSICHLLPCFNSYSSRCREINSHSNRHKVIDHCGFNVHFSTGQCCWAIFKWLKRHRFIKLYAQIFWPLKNIGCFNLNFSLLRSCCCHCF